jgi:hypothetical protein
MAHLGSGWEVTCPDGRVRHWPYVSRSDAETACLAFSAGACRAHTRPSALETGQPRCPGGRHTVGPTAFLARAASKGAA